MHATPQDLTPDAASALFVALTETLGIRPPDELRLLAVGLERREEAADGSANCEDDPRVEAMGYSCGMLSAFCESRLHELASSQNKELPEGIPKEAKVKDACRKTCGACVASEKLLDTKRPADRAPPLGCTDRPRASPAEGGAGRRRRLQSEELRSAGGGGSRASESPLLIDFGVKWTQTQAAFDALLSPDFSKRLLDALYRQLLQRGVTLVDPEDGSLISAAAELKRRPFAYVLQDATPRQLPLAFWEGGFGEFSSPAAAKAVFAVAGLPPPNTQSLTFAKVPAADGKGDASPPHVAVQYSLLRDAPELLPLPPGVLALQGACFQDDARLPASATERGCCRMHEEIQVGANETLQQRRLFLENPPRPAWG